MNRCLQFAAIVLVASSAFACGSERWDVKTLQDHFFPVTTDPQLRTVGALRNMPRPTSLKARAAPEKVYVTVPAMLRGFKLEADGDFHLVIAAPNRGSETMIAEIPDPA